MDGGGPMPAWYHAFDLPTSYPLADKSDSPWAPGNYIGWV